MIERADGRLKIFKEPGDGAYSIGCDVAEGLQTGDSSTAFVMDKDFNQCASWCGKVDPDQFGELLVKLGRYYNNALVAVEVNNHGHATVAAMKRKSYLNVYTRTVKEERGEGYTNKIGWQTNVKTKMLMLDEFVAVVRDGSIIINDVDLLKEMSGISIEPNGDVSLNGKDLVVSACIAIQAIKQASEGNFKAFEPLEVIPNPKTIKEKIAFYNKRESRDYNFE